MRDKVVEVMKGYIRPFYGVIFPFKQSVQGSGCVAISVNESPSGLAEVKRMSVRACSRS